MEKRDWIRPVLSLIIISILVYTGLWVYALVLIFIVGFYYVLLWEPFSPASSRKTDLDNWLGLAENGVLDDEVEQYIFVDEAPREKESYLDYRLVLGPDRGEDRWGVIRCNEATSIPRDSKIGILQAGEVVQLEGRIFQSVLAVLIPRNQTDEFDDKLEIYDLPERLTEIEVPEKTVWDDSQLVALALSFDGS